jgi:hypothetical protein
MLDKDKVLCRTNSVQNKHNLYYKRSTLVILPPIASEDTFKQHVLRSSYQTKIWLIAHIPKPAVALPLESMVAKMESLVLNQYLRTCCLNVSSLGGSLTKVESLTVSNFTRNLFRSIWHRFDFPFGSYSLEVKCHLTFCRTSYAREDPFVVKVVFVLNRICLAQNFVLAKH